MEIFNRSALRGHKVLCTYDNYLSLQIAFYNEAVKRGHNQIILRKNAMYLVTGTQDKKLFTAR